MSLDDKEECNELLEQGSAFSRVCQRPPLLVHSCHHTDSFPPPGLRDILKSWQEMCNEISQKSYDYLDYRDHRFDSDLEVFAASVRELLRRIHIMVEKEHEEIWETPMAYKMLARCGSAGCRIVPLVVP